MTQLVKNLPAMQETWVQSLGWEDPLEKGKDTHSSILPGEFHGLYSPWGCKELATTELLSLSLSRGFDTVPVCLSIGPDFHAVACRTQVGSGLALSCLWVGLGIDNIRREGGFQIVACQH